MTEQPLAQVTLFADLPPDELALLAARATIRSFPKNAILINEGDQSDSLYLILSGLVKVYVSDDEGREMLLDMMGAGEYFGELSLIDQEPRSASVITVEACKIMIVSRDNFIDCLQNNVAIAISLLKVLAAKVRHQTDNAKSLALMSVYERVVKALLELARDNNGELIIAGVSHQALADRVYASREMVTLILKELKAGAYIDSDRKRIVIRKKLPSKW